MLYQYAADVRPFSIFQMLYQLPFFMEMCISFSLYRLSVASSATWETMVLARTLLLFTTEQTHFGKLVAILSASSDIIWVFSLNFAVICYDLWVDAVVDCDAAHGGHACRQAIAGTLQGASLWLRSITTDHFTSGSSVQRAASRSSYVFFWSIDPVKLCASGAVLVHTAKPSS